MQNEYKGFSLFNDIDDSDLRNRNRAVILANIAESHIKDKKISPSGAGLILRYFSLIPGDEREVVKDKFQVAMQQRGFLATA